MIRMALIPLILITTAVHLAEPAGAEGVASSKHNLSVRGAADPMARICVFCHTPHTVRPSTPMWNRNLPRLVYTPYQSSTLHVSPGQPTGASKLCLSCHDGTIAMGRVLSPSGPKAGGGRMEGRANLTTDLSDDHPISFVFDAAAVAKSGELVNPGRLENSKVRLDESGQVQCTTCHDPHYAPVPNFLVMDNEGAALCVVCHLKRGWRGSSHANSHATWNGAGIDPWPHGDSLTVAGNGCANCHTPHAAESEERLLQFRSEEMNCLVCHGGNVARTDIAADLRKRSRHDVYQASGVHDPTEDPGRMTRHVECVDCHNPHAAADEAGAMTSLSGALRLVSGVGMSGARATSVTHEYEVCLKCHGDSPVAPAPRIPRAVLQPNIRLKFQPNSPSMHPVMAPGRNPDVPSLRFPLDENSVIQCTSCHASDTAPSAGGNGPAGPHGSNWPSILEREYRTADLTAESLQAYALCYKCHNRHIVLSDRSFPLHREHVAAQHAPCSACHDPHGIDPGQGQDNGHSHLINFDVSIVKREGTTGRREFTDQGSGRGECTLTCHQSAHIGRTYGP